MRNAFGFVAALLLLVVAVPSWAGPAGVAYVDIQRAMNDSEHGKNVKLELEGIVKEKSAGIEALAVERDSLQAELEKNRIMMSEEAVREKVDRLGKIEREAERMIEESNEELGRLQREKEISILKELDDIISAIGREKGYVAILPAEVVLYAPEGTDITDMVIERYNKLKGLEPSEKD
jgi:outer membrane protein